MTKYDPTRPLISLHIPKCGGSTLERILSLWFNNGRVFPNLYNHPRILEKLWKSRLDLRIQSLGGYGFIKHEYMHKKGYYPRRIKANQFTTLLGRKIPICLHGHFEADGMKGNVNNYYPNGQYITFLRDPLEMEISMYNYKEQLYRSGEVMFKGRKSKSGFSMSLDDYIEKQKTYLLNTMPYRFSESNYKEIIQEKFLFVGLLEYFDESVQVLAKKLNKEAPCYQKENVTKSKRRPSKKVEEVFRERNQLEYKVFNFVKKILHAK